MTSLNILAVDGGKRNLDELVRTIQAVEPEASIVAFLEAESALEWPGLADVNVVFLDAKLPGMSGIAFAHELQERNPRVNIVFVTGHSVYAKDAFELHASGFIMKPATTDRVRFELDHLRYPLPSGSPAPAVAESPVLYAHCFGNFEAYAGGKPLICRSAQSLEMLAYLIDRRGTRCTVGEVEATLWGDLPRTPSRTSRLRNLVADLSRSLDNAGCNGVLLRQYGAMGLDTRLIACDYWDYLDNKPGARNLFHGEYMTQYSWAEHTLGNLYL